MLSETVKETIKDAERYHRKIWLMMTVSSMLFLLLGYTTPNHSQNSIPRNVDTSLIYLLYIVAFCLGVLSVGLRYYLLSNRKIETRITKEPNLKLIAKKRQTDEVDFKRLEVSNKLETYEQRLVALSGWILNRSIYSWGINSMIAFTGYIVGIITKSFAIITPFVAGALILDFIMFPMLQKFMEKQNNANNAE